MPIGTFSIVLLVQRNSILKTPTSSSKNNSTKNAFNMKTLFPFLLLFWYSWGTLVVQLPYDKKDKNFKTILTLEKKIEITNSILFCVRFKFERHAQWTFLFSSENDALSFRLNPKESVSGTDNFGTGFVILKGIMLIFKIPIKLAPNKWYHFCFNSNGENYHVIVNGILWYSGYHTTKVFANMTIGKSNF